MQTKALFYRLFGGGQALRVSPGDNLFESIRAGAPEAPLSTRDLATHWAVRSVHGHIARGLAGCALGDEMQAGPTETDTVNTRARGGDTMAGLLRPHTRRIAKDVLRFGEAVLVMAADDGGRVRELVPLRPDEVSRDEEDNYLVGEEKYAPDKVLHIADELPAESPLESLRPLLEEDVAAQAWRKSAWKTAPRGIVARPDTAPEWQEESMVRFAESFLNSLRGGGKGDAPIGVLEEGMEWIDTPLPDAAAAQFIEARKLTADAVATVYGVNGSLLATGADRQLMPARRQLLNGPVADLGKLIGDCAADQLAMKVYGDQALNGRIRPVFDIASAVRSEDEEAGVKTDSVGRPWRTVNEMRALEGRDPIEGGDELAQPAAKTVVTQ